MPHAFLMSSEIEMLERVGTSLCCLSSGAGGGGGWVGVGAGVFAGGGGSEPHAASSASEQTVRARFLIKDLLGLSSRALGREGVRNARLYNLVPGEVRSTTFPGFAQRPRSG